MNSAGWQPPAPPRRVPQRRTLWLAAPLVAVFAVAGVIIELVDSSRHTEPGQLIASLLVFGPLAGSVLLIAPAAILASSSASRPWIVAAEALIAPLVVVVLIVVSTDDHSTAGVALMYIPIFGSVIAGAVSYCSRLRA